MKNKTPYSMLIQWSDEDQAYLVTLPEWASDAKTHGKTYEEAAKNGKIALELFIESYKDHNRPLPQPDLYNSALD
jgi:predicted RNase H-like HicB family nuclease